MIYDILVVIEMIIVLFLAFKLFLDEGEIEVLHSLLWKQQNTIFYLKRNLAELYMEEGKILEEEKMVWQKQRQRKS